jgi:hypothetical protein
MKKTLHKLLVVAIVMLTMLAGSSTFAQVVLNSTQQNGVVLNENSFTGIRVTNSFAGFNHFDVNTKEGVFTEISATGYTFTWEEGSPKLPVMRRLIEIPVGAQPEVSIVSYDVTEYTLSDLGITHPIFPTQPAVAKDNKNPVDFVKNNVVYTTDNFNENILAKVEVVGTMRNMRIARLEIAPVAYNPVQGTIKVYSNVVVDVQFTGADYSATSLLNSKTRSPYFGGFSFLNKLPKGSDRENFTSYPVKMVIVSDPMFEEALQPYIEWKTKKGFTIVEGYTDDPAVGTTTASIKTYLQGLYNAGTTEDPSPSFVLFVGDVAQVPAYSQGGHVTDLYYCEYTGDKIPEMFYGRFSATSLAQLQPQIDKTLMYEQYQFPDPSFLGEVVMVSGVDGSFAPIHGNGQINYGTSTYFNEAHGIESHTYLYPASGSSAAAIRQNVSDGVAYGNYTAHGSSSGWADPSFTISDIPALQNYGKYPLLVGNCCLTSTYNTSCFGEELLRAQDKGAVGYIGGSNSSYWDEDFYFGVGVGNVVLNPTYEGTTLGSYDRAFHDHGEPFEDWFTTQAQMLVAGNLAVTESGSSRTTYYWEIYCLMGDPSLMIYFSVPDEMTASYEPLMPLQSLSFTVNTDPYAYVAISKEGVLYGSALADENGVAEVMLDPISVPGEADVVITAQNRQPYIGTVLVASPEGPYVLMQSQAVNDEGGNNNQVPEYNEHFGFNMSLKNVGNTASQELSVTLATVSPYAEVITATHTWPNIAAGEVIGLENIFEVAASEWLPDQHAAQFTLEISNGTETWNSSFIVKLNAPVLMSGNVTIDDLINGSGNGNGRLDAGENVMLSLKVNNEGHCIAPATEAYLFTDSEWVVVDSVKTMVGDIGSGSSLQSFYNVSVSADAPVGTAVNFYFSNASGPYSSSKIYTPKVGLIIEDFESGDFSAYAWNNASLSPWTITTNPVHGGTYAARSGVIGNSASTALQITMDVASADNISFARKVSSESGYDFLKFYIDGSEKGSWAGDANWEVVSYPVTAGSHTFKWTYSKDGSQTGGTDAAYIDDIVFPSSNGGGTGTDFAVKAFAYPAALCGEGEVNLFAFAMNATGDDLVYNWAPAEMLYNPALYNPVAMIASTTLFSVEVMDGLLNTSTEIEIIVDAKPEMPSIEQNDTDLISSAETGNQWYNTEGPIEGAVNQVYVPEVSDYYYVVVTSENGCISDPSEQIYFSMVGVGNQELSNALKVYPNPFRNQLNVEFGVIQTGQVKISLLNLLGQEVRLIEQGSFTSGNHNITFTAKGLLPGIYFLKMDSSNGTDVKKVVLSE